MPRIINKRASFMIAIVLVSTFLVYPGAAKADTRNMPLSMAQVSVKPEAQSLGTIQICEFNVPSITPIINGEIPLKFAIKLPSGSKYAYCPAPGDESSYVSIPETAGLTPNGLKPGDVKIDGTSTSTTLVLNVVTRSNFLDRAIINVIFNKPHSQVVIGSLNGDYVVSIIEIKYLAEVTGAVTPAELVNGYFGNGYVTARAAEVPELNPGIGRVPAEITLVENKPGALQASKKAVSLTLPQGITWNTVRLKQSGGFLEGDVTFDEKTGIDLDEQGRSRLWLDVNRSSLNLPWPMDPVHKTSGEPGIVKIQGFFNISPTAEAGNIAVNIAGPEQEINPQALVIGYLSGTVPPAATPGSDTNKSTFTIGEGVFTLNGVNAVMETAPYIKGGRTYLPLRYVAYALGIPESGIWWDSSEQTVSLSKGNQQIKLQIGSTILMINGRIAGYLDVVPEIQNGLTMLPVGIIADKLGGQVEWDVNHYQVNIIYPKPGS